MEEILKQDTNYRLILEKITISTNKGWWLSLHYRKSGECQTLIFKNKEAAKICFYDNKTKDYKSFEEIQKQCDKLNLEKQKVYKENI